jgi:putative transposase
MSRREQVILGDVPHHVIQRGNNRTAIFFEDDDYRQYKSYLLEASERYKCLIHAYCLMTNHVHLLISPEVKNGVSRMMQTLGRNFVRYINKKYKRTGTLWEGRFRASPIDAEEYLFSCMRYIENNPVRARMVRKVQDYAWSSYHANALGAQDLLVAPHALYTSLGRDRHKAYGELFKLKGNVELEDIRKALHGNWALGSKKFVKSVERKSGIHAAPLPRGGDRRSKKFKNAN